MTETTEKYDTAELNSVSSPRKSSGNTMLTIKLMIVAGVLLAVLWVLDAVLTK